MNKAFFIKLGFTLLEILLFVLLSAILIVSYTALFKVLALVDGPVKSETDPFWGLAIEYLPLNAAFLLAYFVVRKFVFKRSFAELGFNREKVLVGLGKGFIESALIITVGVIVLTILQKLEYTGVQWNSSLFVGFLVLFLFQSLSEEILTRGFLLGVIAHRFGNYWALAVSSLLFSLLHFFNPDFNWLAGLNILLAGLALGLLYIKYQNLWVCTGFHWGWNFMQSAFYDFNVSGFDIASLISFSSLPPAWLTGGGFGFEGSILSVIALTAFCGYYGFKTDFSGVIGEGE
jgi:hypothetical protein